MCVDAELPLFYECIVGRIPMWIRTGFDSAACGVCLFWEPRGWLFRTATPLCLVCCHRGRSYCILWSTTHNEHVQEYGDVDIVLCAEIFGAGLGPPGGAAGKGALQS